MWLDGVFGWASGAEHRSTRTGDVMGRGDGNVLVGVPQGRPEGGPPLRGETKPRCGPLESFGGLGAFGTKINYGV